MGLSMRRREAIVAGMWLRTFMAGVLCGVAASGAARGDSYTGAAWAVHFNLPDQTTSAGSIGPDEFLIRDRFLARIEALGSGDWACLTTFTFSGNTASGGAAGPVLEAIQRALARGARVGFAVDKGVDISSNFWPGVSLRSLSLQAGNKLELAQAPPASSIMHHKLGVFWYRTAQEAWVLSGSWNFTGGASSQQWNILTEIQNNALGSASSNEMRELLSGHFHSNPAKSTAHDGSRFRLAGMDRDGWVRFGPFDGVYTGNNALTDIVAAIGEAEDEIFFALNKLTRQDVVDALIAACNRGVIIEGVIPKSDRSQPSHASYEMYQRLKDPANYTTRNRVRMVEAYYDAPRTRLDNINRDLVHTKYMVIDPRGARPMVIHGSANWTASALVLKSLNDENVQFLPHRGMAEAFRVHFARMTDGMKPWCDWRPGGGLSTFRLAYWLPAAETYEVVWTENLRAPGSWTNRVQILPILRGTNSVEIPRAGGQRFYRIQPL